MEVIKNLLSMVISLLMMVPAFILLFGEGETVLPNFIGIAYLYFLIFFFSKTLIGRRIYKRMTINLMKIANLF